MLTRLKLMVTSALISSLLGWNSVYAGETAEEDGVKIMGPLNLPATVPFHASQMYSHNITTFFKHLLTEEGVLQLDMEDEITRETLVMRDGEIVHPRIRDSEGGD